MLKMQNRSDKLLCASVVVVVVVVVSLSNRVLSRRFLFIVNHPARRYVIIMRVTRCEWGVVLRDDQRA